MAHRISISIPNELHERIQQYKDELNVSKICQKALMSAIERIEKKESSAQEYGDIVERLRDEFIKDNEKIIDEEALEAAEGAAKRLSLKTIKEFIEDRSEFFNADPETLFKLYGDKKISTNSAFFESTLIRSLFYKKWSDHFLWALESIKDDFERAINEVDE